MATEKWDAAIENYTKAGDYADAEEKIALCEARKNGTAAEETPVQEETAAEEAEAPAAETAAEETPAAAETAEDAAEEPAAEGAAEEAAPDAEATPVTTTASDNK